MFAGLKKMAQDFKDGATEMGVGMILGSDMALNAVNKYTERYATVKKMSKIDGGISFIVQPKGSQEFVEVTAKHITFAEDNSTVKIGEITANMEWVQNSLQDFVQGKEYVIPEASRGIAGNVKKFM